jgi:hypothetical protein
MLLRYNISNMQTIMMLWSVALSPTMPQDAIFKRKIISREVCVCIDLLSRKNTKGDKRFNFAVKQERLFLGSGSMSVRFNSLTKFSSLRTCRTNMLITGHGPSLLSFTDIHLRSLTNISYYYMFQTQRSTKIFPSKRVILSQMRRYRLAILIQMALIYAVGTNLAIIFQ